MFNMSNYKLVTTPLIAHFKLSSQIYPTFVVKIEKMSHGPYSSAVRSLTYVMVCTRPDLADVVSVMSCYMHNPGKNHWEAMKWIFCYVKGYLDRCLVFDKSKTATYIMLSGTLIQTMMKILMAGVIHQAISSLYVLVLSPGKHPYNQLQLYRLLNQNTLL